jgi:hypothetical protein
VPATKVGRGQESRKKSSQVLGVRPHDSGVREERQFQCHSFENP